MPYCLSRTLKTRRIEIRLLVKLQTESALSACAIQCCHYVHHSIPQ